MALTKDELLFIQDRVADGGKSPLTGIQGIAAAAHAIDLIQREIRALDQEAAFDGLTKTPASANGVSTSAPL
jgi:hypothetical protein